MWRVGIDVGGTFTDLFAWNEKTGQSVTAKTLTTKSNRSVGLLKAIEIAGIPVSDITYLMHGTTTATNALIERDYPDSAFITTEGFRDVLEIGRQSRQVLYDPYQKKPVPLIRRRNRFSVNERVSATGAIRRPLDEEQVRTIAQTINDRGIRSVGVGLINGYSNPVHEEKIRDIVLSIIPDCHVSISFDTRPMFREHARFIATAIRTTLKPVMVKYFNDLEDNLASKGFSGRLLILKSNGGVMGSKLAKERPEELIESGPSGGVAYASHLSTTTGHKNIIHTDVGGTSFDVSTIEDGKGHITRRYELEWEVPVTVPMLEIHSVGAGGGSIGWVDAGGSLRVGPKSAGSEPGPACYGKGGTQATVTDANLILGRLNPSLGGKFNLDLAAAESAMDRLAEKIGLSRYETAEGMIRISCEKMAEAVKGVVQARARDPRDYVFASFGGAGPMHACFIAQSMGVEKILIPYYAGVASAFGATTMNLRYDVESFYYTPVQDVDLDKLNSMYEKLEEQGRALLKEDGVLGDSVKISRVAQMRYVGQVFEVNTEIPSGVISKDMLPAITDAFHAAHKAEYGVSTEVFPVAFVSLGVSVFGDLVQKKYDSSPARTQNGETSGNGTKRSVYFRDKWEETNVIDYHSLTEGSRFSGPAIVEYADSCSVIPRGWLGEIDKSGNLLLEIGKH